MKKITHYILKTLLYILSLLPFWLLYRLSDILFFIIYYLIGYRRKITFQNLQKSFPEKNTKDLNHIERRFYLFLTDLMVETIKLMSISKKSIIKRCHFSDETAALINKLYSEKKHIIFAMGHFGNWEWAGPATSLVTQHPLFAIYKPLSNPFFDQLLYNIRTRFGTKLIAMNNTWKEMLQNQSHIHATAFIADQTPSPEHAYWTTFLNQDTPVFWGIEKIARKLNYPVVFVSVRRIKRGYYTIFSELLSERPANTMEGELSEKHTRKLEQEIIQQPETWLWSHRRWKHKRPSTHEKI